MISGVVDPFYGIKKVVRQLKIKKGLSEVVSTLILLVVTILLASVVTYYATNITTTRTKTEEVSVSKAHIWVNNSGAIAAVKLQNLGGKDILIDKLAVRGVKSDWSDVFVYRIPTGFSILGDLNCTDYAGLVDGVSIDGKVYNVSIGDIPLMSGGGLLIYVKDPDNIQLDDIGTTVSMTIFTKNALYITECNVQSATIQ